MDVVGGSTGRLERIWTAECDSPTAFSSLAKVNPMIAFTRIAGTTTVHLRGPETKATTMSCASDAEYFGAELRVGAYLRPFPPARLANLRDGSASEVVPARAGERGGDGEPHSGLEDVLPTDAAIGDRALGGGDLVERYDGMHPHR